MLHDVGNNRDCDVDVDHRNNTTTQYCLNVQAYVRRALASDAIQLPSVGTEPQFGALSVDSVQPLSSSLEAELSAYL